MGREINGVPTLKPVAVRDLKLPCFAGALESCLHVTRHPSNFIDIIGSSGLAFRTRWRVTGDGPIGCPCSPVGECESVAKAVEKSLGWRIEGHWGDVGGWKNPDLQRVIPDIISSIDGSMPVFVIDKHLDSAVIYGYTDDGDFLVHTYYEDSCRLALQN
jgi:hypothetical protein